MANLFIGFPVPRAKIADMIEGSAPPKEHGSWHLPNGDDPIILPADITTDQIVQWDGTKLIGIDAPAGGPSLSPISMSPYGFDPQRDDTDYSKSGGELRKRTTLDVAWFGAPVYLPQGAVVTKLTVYGKVDNANSTVWFYLKRNSNIGLSQVLASAGFQGAFGQTSAYDDSIDYSEIDNTQYVYYVDGQINPDTVTDDASLYRVMIEFS